MRIRQKTMMDRMNAERADDVLADLEAKHGCAAPPCSLPVGTRIRFLRTLEEGPCEEHPGCIYAVKGDFGTVTGHGCKEGHWVKWDHWRNAFGAKLGEDFEAANAEVSDGRSLTQPKTSSESGHSLH